MDREAAELAEVKTYALNEHSNGQAKIARLQVASKLVSDRLLEIGGDETQIALS